MQTTPKRSQSDSRAALYLAASRLQNEQEQLLELPGEPNAAFHSVDLEGPPMSDQYSYDNFEFEHDATNDFALNPEPRCPCVLVLDVSYSMSGARIDELNAGLVALQEALQADELALKRVEIGLVTFGPVSAVLQFASAATFQAPRLEPARDTPLGGALETALDMVEARKQEYRANGIKYYRPWIFLITDGAPTDDWRNAAARIKKAEQDKAIAFFPIGIQDADMTVLNQLGERAAIKLQGLQFREMFIWLSSSLSAVSQSVPGDLVALEAPRGWASV